MTQTFLAVLRSVLWRMKRKRSWEFPGGFDVVCHWSRGLCVRPLVTLWCVSCLALIQLGTKIPVLQAITYGSGCFLGYKGIFITSKRGSEKGRARERHRKKRVRLVLPSKEERKKGEVSCTDHKVALIKPAVQMDTVNTPPRLGEVSLRAGRNSR